MTPRPARQTKGPLDMTIDNNSELTREEIMRLLRRKRDFLEGFANALRGRQRKSLLYQVVEIGALLNRLDKNPNG